MLDIQRSNPELTEEKICEEILGKRSGYVKGFGFGPRPETFGSRYGAYATAENEALKSEISRLNGVLESQNATIESQGVMIKKIMAMLSRMEGSS